MSLINVSPEFIEVLKSPIKELYLKFEFYDSNMNFIDVFEHRVIQDDLGALTDDKSRPIKRTFSFSLDNSKNEFNWGDENNLIWIDKRVKLYIGLKLPNGSIEYVPQGVFILTQPQDTHNFDGKRALIQGVDKAYLLTDKRGKLINELIIEEGTSIPQAIKIIAQSAGETLFNFDSDIDATVPYELSFNANDNRWKVIEDLAILAKCMVYYDVHGYLRLKKIDLNNLQNEPSTWKYHYGDPSEKFYAGNIRRLDETNLANHIRVLGGSGQTAEVIYDLVVDEHYVFEHYDKDVDDFKGTFYNTRINVDGDLQLESQYKMEDSFDGFELDATKWDEYKHNDGSNVVVSERLILATNEVEQYTGTGVHTKQHLPLEGVVEVDFDWIPGSHSTEVGIPAPHVLICASGASRDATYGHRTNKFLRLSLSNTDDEEYRTKIILESPGRTIEEITFSSPIYMDTENNVKLFLDIEKLSCSVYFNSELLIDSVEILQTEIDDIGANFIFEIYKASKSFTAAERFDNIIIRSGLFRGYGWYESQAIDISKVGIVLNSLLMWIGDISSKDKVEVWIRFSKDGGKTWGKWYCLDNNAEITNLVNGTAVINTKFQYRVILGKSWLIDLNKEFLAR